MSHEALMEMIYESLLIELGRIPTDEEIEAEALRLEAQSYDDWYDHAESELKGK